MKVYYGQDRSTGKWYVWSECPRVTQWGETQTEAEDKFNDYIEQHYALTLASPLRPFPPPHQEAQP